MKIKNIKWDTESDDEILTAEEIGLPEDIEIDDMEEDEVADYLSDTYGYCVVNFGTD